MKKEQTLGELCRQIIDETAQAILNTIYSMSEPNSEIPKHLKNGMTEVKPKRARTKKGRYKADDKSTKDVNEAWVDGKAPKKRRKK